MTRQEFLQSVRGNELDSRALPEDVQAAAKKFRAVDRDGVIRKWDRFFSAADYPDRDGSRHSVTAHDGVKETWSGSMLHAAMTSDKLRPKTAVGPSDRRDVSAIGAGRSIDEPGGTQRGIASFYTMGHITANGEKWNAGISDRVEHLSDYKQPRGQVPEGLGPDTPIYTAAHRTAAFGRIFKVTPEGQKPFFVRINDRGPFEQGRIIDLSRAGARAADIADGRGLTRVQIENTGFRVESTVEKWRAPPEPKPKPKTYAHRPRR